MRVQRTLLSRQLSSVSAFFCAMWVIVVVILVEDSGAGASLLVHKYSTRVVRTKYGPLRGVMIHINPPVEAFLGVPYATPPVGSLRYMPPVTPSIWKNTRLADRFGAVCPQRPPDIGNRSEALLEFPRGRLLYLEKLLPLLANESEDCLYLNLYVPRTATGEEETNPLPCVVYVHGESYEWNSGNPYDGTVLASTGRVIVVTINFRLGVLGFLKTGTKGSAQGNFGLMDLVAGLHWLRENLPAFGGDPERVTLMGHGTGAALVNFIAVSPVAKELLHRVILLSGSGLSPWALQRDPLSVKRSVAEHTNCHGDLHEDDLAPCLRKKPLDELLKVRIDSPRFLPGFAPFIDGTILLNPSSAPPAGSTSTVATSAGYELADFPERDLLFGLTSTESYLDLNAQDLEFGFNETRRDRILRTYVRNSYYYHLNEIFSTLKNEYTDWERPTQNPLSVRDATLDVLSDGHTAAPLIRVGYLHSMRGGKTFFLHFQHQTGDRDFPMRAGSVRGEDLPYILGLPLIGGGSFFPHNYSHSDVTVSKTLIHYISNFARKGDPNGAVPNASASEAKNSQKGHEEMNTPYWDTYDTINQLYLELGNRPEMRNHYRGHKMSLWLNLIPQLHRPGEGDDVSMRHHHFQEEDEQYYDGSVRPQTKEKPPLVHVIAAPPPATTVRVPPATTSLPPPPPKSDTALQATTTECPPNNTIIVPSVSKNNNNLLRKLASSHYQSYTTALTVTIAVGCFLLLLNIVIFAGIYHQRDRSKNKKKEELAEAGSCSSSSGENYDKAFESRQISYECGGKSPYEISRGSFKTSYGGEFSCDKRLEVQMTELPLQEFNSSPPPAKRIESYPPDVTSTNQEKPPVTSPGIPEPPPPPKGQPPAACNQTGILRAQGAPTTPGTMKKRVQIQEISV
ncbi:neuroligin-1 [Tribolium castaneum]|uniref:Neuroligin-1-like Protein n=1 Tax=Tribolium castaneum TaxID=7070 RepID=A0A139WHE8_TRICA|nr:PREDICTED: neuroligin-1 isoform X1 [Tribolium castaneum]XP_015835929.1 PREDICTED: neuroligin-1 isoform X1 [Tribolium castaneum]KYB27420.1 Neuroligin-1-like Protein [Tribolium castaneum]|eukprot:XP_015835928.1 PREDICTED: neuroligin-1 isoform X1 [Tribolium castaneum]